MSEQDIEDIVPRLRIGVVNTVEAARTMKEAADEIESLRAQVERLEGEKPQPDRGELVERIMDSLIPMEREAKVCGNPDCDHCKRMLLLRDCLSALTDPDNVVAPEVKSIKHSRALTWVRLERRGELMRSSGARTEVLDILSTIEKALSGQGGGK